jgi:hypothetical protein
MSDRANQFWAGKNELPTAQTNIQGSKCEFPTEANYSKMNFRRKPILEANVNVRRGKLPMTAENHTPQVPRNVVMQRQVFRFRS